MMMQCTETTRFSGSGFCGAPQFDTTNNGSRPRDPPHGTGKKGGDLNLLASCRSRDTTNKRSLSVIVKRTLREQRAKVEVSTDKATSNFDRMREKMRPNPLQCTRANRKGS